MVMHMHIKLMNTFGNWLIPFRQFPALYLHLASWWHRSVLLPENRNPGGLFWGIQRHVR